MAKHTGVRAKGTGIEIRFCIGKQPFSHFLNKPATAKNLSDAAEYRAKQIKLERRRLATAEDGDTFRPIRFEDACLAYLKDLELSGDVTASSVDTYGKRLAVTWSELHDDQLHTITTVRIREIDRARGWKSQRTRRDHLSALRGVFSWALDAGCYGVKVNPVRDYKIGKIPKRLIDKYDDEELEAIFPHVPARPRPLFQFMLATGCRTSEARALEWPDVHREYVHIKATLWEGARTDTKNHQEREVLLSNEAKRVLREQTETRFKGGNVFQTQYGNPYCLKHLTGFWKEACRLAGVRYRRPYTLRHTYASRALEADAAPGFIAAQMGDLVETVLRNYAHWNDKDRSRQELAKIEAHLASKKGAKR